ncbi:MAG: hypothetical protein K2X69_09425, partial [Silvanigrellaceae bacterium]|nr:hypothetical protein [Silvanigrellaceae bacterium]
DFHEIHKDNPNKKLVQTCHSQGAIHVYNTLASLPKEVTDRVLVINLGGARVIPDRMCYKAFNYASKNDIVHYGEIVFASFLDPSDMESSDLMQTLIQDRKELVFLDPHPDAEGIDHGFDTPTFEDVLGKHLNTYIERNGEYPEKYEMLNETGNNHLKY